MGGGMVQVRVVGIAIDESGQHVVLLGPIDALPGEGRILPIWIGSLEATSILVAVEGADVPRPMAHDLMRSLLEAMDAQVDKVEVTRIEDGTYYAEITVTGPAGERIVDARPSDAIGLAARTGATIWVADAVLAEAGVADITVGADEAEAAQDSIAEFQEFLKDVDPDDFRG
ncbi:MAG TPA: bifunctional nuclease family protein [Agromyces sp.]